MESWNEINGIYKVLDQMFVHLQYLTLNTLSWGVFSGHRTAIDSFRFTYLSYEYLKKKLIMKCYWFNDKTYFLLRVLLVSPSSPNLFAWPNAINSAIGYCGEKNMVESCLANPYIDSHGHLSPEDSRMSEWACDMTIRRWRKISIMLE